VRGRFGAGAAAIASGALLASAFPDVSWHACAWFALVPLLRAIDGGRVPRAFALGWLCGTTFFLLVMDWIPATITRTGESGPLVALLALLALAAVLGTYFGLFAAGLRFWQLRTGGEGLVMATLLWVALEWCRSTLLLACPWELLGYSQLPNLRLVQIADLTGIYGVGALVVAVNHVLHQASLRRVSLAAMTLVVALWLVAFLYGDRRLAEMNERQPERVLRVALVQPAIDPNEKWDPARREAAIAVQEELSRQAVADGAELVVWPEASAPYVFAADDFYERYSHAFDADRALHDRMLGFVRDLEVPLLFGSAALVSRPVGRGEAWSSLNRSLLLNPDGRTRAQYDKMILVPFGETVPLPRLLFFVHKLVPGIGNFLAGTEPTLFPASDARFAVLICYEATFPDFVRQVVDRGADFLVNQTNDAWFGPSRAPYQHLAMAAVRAIENRLPLVRVANTGISAVVGPDGRLQSTIPLGERAVKVADVGLARRPPSFYTRHGDVFAHGAVLAAALMVLYAGWIIPGPQPRKDSHALGR